MTLFKEGLLRPTHDLDACIGLKFHGRITLGLPPAKPFRAKLQVCLRPGSGYRYSLPFPSGQHELKHAALSLSHWRVRDWVVNDVQFKTQNAQI